MDIMRHSVALKSRKVSRMDVLTTATNNNSNSSSNLCLPRINTEMRTKLMTPMDRQFYCSHHV